MTQFATIDLPAKPGTMLRCIKPHPDGLFIIGEEYRVCAQRITDKYVGIRIRDSRRERKDFNFISTSKNYVWTYFEKINNK